MNLNNIGIGGGANDGYELFREFDRPNLIGVVDFTKFYGDYYNFASDGTPSYTPYQGTSYDVTSEFINSDKTEFFSLGNAKLYANGVALKEYAKGQYTVPASYNKVNHFGSEYNTVQIDSNQYFDALTDSVAFGNAIQITNLPAGSEIDRNQDFFMDLTGASSNALIVWGMVLERSEFNLFDTTHVASLATDVVKYTNRLKISTNTLGMLKSGFYRLTVSAYEPKYITTSEGQEICLLGRSVYATTIQIVD